jgi:hypothetical protein
MEPKNTAGLTRKQQGLVRELKDICTEFNFSFHNI